MQRSSAPMFGSVSELMGGNTSKLRMPPSVECTVSELKHPFEQQPIDRPVTIGADAQVAGCD
ncbi:MAG: hypothetical protein EON59_07460 [Alphaproteobacteria bacterium]|nr:MAG: hypothetical protein EON59_07460 [Alphaproteobacteria bacterium]